MTIEQVLNQATIVFESPLSLEQTGILLDYIRDNLPARISSKTEIYEERSKDRETKVQMRTRGTVKISGNIINASSPISFGSFETIPYSEDSSQIRGIRFQTIPGYDLKEHRREEVQLWQDVKKQVANYFKQ